MENQNERNLQRRAELMAKHRLIIAKVAREKELEREKEGEREREMKKERELEHITKAKQVAAVREQNQNLLMNSNKNERARRNGRLGIKYRPQVRKTAGGASRGCAVSTMREMKKPVEIADGASKYGLLVAAISELYGSRSIFED